MTSGCWKIDELARMSQLTVDTIRFYQREGLLPAAERAGRNRLYGPEHLERLERIRELQARRFSLAAIRALLDIERPEIAEGVFGVGDASYSFDDLVERSGIGVALAERLREVGLLRDPAAFGRREYDAADLHVLRAVTDLTSLGMPPEFVVEMAKTYTRGVTQMESEVLDLIVGKRGTGLDPEELGELHDRLVSASRPLMQLSGRLLLYIQQRTLQSLTLSLLEEAARAKGGEPATS